MISLPRSGTRSTFFILLCAVAAALASRPAWAADPEVSGAEGGDSNPTPPPALKPDGAPAPASTPAITVERLPPSAYPAWQPRGIPGGSLWLDPSFHGMPWPYYLRTGIGLSGSVWVDNSYQKVDRDLRFPQTAFWLHQSRAVLRATPTYSSGDFFVQGQVEIVGNYNQTVQRGDAPDTDDLWLRFGQWNVWDVQVGRFEAYAVHHFGMGLDINTAERQGALDENSRQPVDFYYVTTMFYRPNGAGNAALHLHFVERPNLGVRFELLAQYGNDSFDRIGTRPAMVVDLGVVKVKLGGEYRLTRPQNTQVENKPRVDAAGNPVLGPDGMQIIDYVHTRNEKTIERGVGGAIQLVLFPWVEAGVQGAYGLSDHTTSMNAIDLDNGSFTQWTVGGFANVSPMPDLVIGGGVHKTDWTNLHRNDLGQYGHKTNLAAFGAVQYLLRKQLYIKLVAAYDKAKREDLEGGTTEVSSTMLSARLRLMYLF